MSNVAPSGKGKQKQQGPKQPAGRDAANTLDPSSQRQSKAAGKRVVAKSKATKSVLGTKGAGKKDFSAEQGASMKGDAPTRFFREGVGLLARAMNFQVGPVMPISPRRGPAPPDDDGFENAYIFLINAIAPSKRRDVIQKMRQGLDKVAQATLKVPPEEAPANNVAKVSTADFMAALERQEQEQRQTEIEAGQLVPVSILVERLNITPQAISTARKKNRMFALKGPSGRLQYPAFFANAAYDREVLEQVCMTLGDLPAGSKWDFFMSPKISLGGKSPLDALAKGKVEAVLAAANAFREE
jgi:hypothetical protein